MKQFPTISYIFARFCEFFANLSIFGKILQFLHRCPRSLTWCRSPHRSSARRACHCPAAGDLRRERGVLLPLVTHQIVCRADSEEDACRREEESGE